MTMVTANANSWTTMKYWVETLDADVLLLQETRVARMGWLLPRPRAVMLAGLGSGSRRWPAGEEALRRAAWRSWPGMAGGWPGSRWKGGLAPGGCVRWLRWMLANRCMWFSVYGYDSGQPEAAEKNAALFQEVFEALAGLGAAQWVVGGDWNEEAPAIWSLVVAEGRGLLLPRALEEDGPVARHL